MTSSEAWEIIVCAAQARGIPSQAEKWWQSLGTKHQTSPAKLRLGPRSFGEAS